MRYFPKEELFGLTAQMRRAAVSVPTNIAEGIGRNYKKDTTQFLYISRGSLYELETLLELSKLLEIENSHSVDAVFHLIKESQQLVNGLINRYQKSDLK